MDTSPIKNQGNFDESTAPLPGSVQCDITKRWVEPDEVITFLGYTVSAEGKEVLLDRLKNGEMVGGLWRDGRTLVVHKDAEFPDRCLVCNQSGPCRDFTPKVIDRRFLRFRAIKIRVPVCPRHRRIHYAASLGDLILISLAMILCTCAVMMDRIWSILLVLACYISAGAAKDRIWQRVPLSGEVIDNEHVRFKGAPKKYLETLPVWQGQ